MFMAKLIRYNIVVIFWIIAWYWVTLSFCAGAHISYYDIMIDQIIVGMRAYHI